jgi:hypothetical protein
MPWPSIPTLIFTDSTTWQKVTSWTKGKVADRKPVYGPVSQPITCSVAPTSAQMVDAHGVEVMVVQHQVTFDAASFPGLHIRDQGTWLETGATLAVIGVEPEGDANGRIWVVTCEERPLL